MMSCSRRFCMLAYIVIILVVTCLGSELEDSRDVQDVFGQPKKLPQFDGCSTGALPMDPEEEKVPTYVIDLDLPPRKRWARLMADKKEAAYKLLQNLKNLTGAVFHGKLFKLIDEYLPSLAETLPYPFYDEILGISEATNITVGDVTLYNIFYEVFTVCTSIIAEGKNGKLYHGRNLDFGLFLGWDTKNHTWLTTEYLKPLVVQLDFKRKGKTVFNSVQLAGYIGILTAMKPKMFSLTIDERFKVAGGYIGIVEWILGYRDQQWMGFLARQVMENATSYKQAQKSLVKTNLLAPVYFILGGSKSGQGCIITRGRRDFDILTLGQRSLGQNGTWYLVETNYDHWKNPPFFDNRRTPAIYCMEKMGKGSVSVQGLFKVLSTKPVLNKLTTYTVIMQVSSGMMQTWLQYCPDPCWPW